jgi:esterase/lipase superfamily enzyme
VVFHSSIPHSKFRIAMHRSHHRWHSPALRRDMDLLVFGHGGARVLAFPTSMGRFWDWEERGLVGALAEPLEQGRAQLVCVDSLDRESWYGHWKHPADRARRHEQYDRYVYEEVLPFSRSLNSDSPLIVTGPSFGGYHAVNFTLRHPESAVRVLSMSGLCDIRRFVDGYYDDAVYYNNPCDYIAHEHEPARLAALKRLDIILAVGHDDPLRESNERLSTLLWNKGVWNALRIWDGFAHDWPEWARMLHLYLDGHD